MRGKLRTFLVAAAGALALMLVAFGGTAVAKDRNHDRIPDKWEKRFHLSLKVDQANKDQDRDKVDNLNEFQEGTNPRDKDTDNDGKPDGREDADHDGLNNAGEDETANLPDDQDTDNDGIEDGEENAGTIASFDGTTLVIDVTGDGQVSGMVDSTTEIECETEDEHELEDESGDDDGVVARASHDDGVESDNSGPGGGDDDADEEDNSGPSDNSGPGNGDEVDGEEDNSGPGSHDEREGDEDDVCAPADLAVGAIVHEAELELEDGQAVFEEVEILK
jgi:hypothetical protein